MQVASNYGRFSGASWTHKQTLVIGFEQQVQEIGLSDRLHRAYNHFTRLIFFRQKNQLMKIDSKKLLTRKQFYNVRR